MEQNIDDFFKRKIEDIQDTLPETSTFDEAALWGNIQQDLHKPKRSIWYWLVPVAACLVTVVSWWTLPHDKESSTTSPVAIVHEKKAEKPMVINEMVQPIELKKYKKTPTLKKKRPATSERLDFQIASISTKSSDFSNKSMSKLPDSLNFQSTIAFEKKPKVNFKTVHINEISKQGEMPFQQPRFKVQFAGKLFEKTETNYKETIQTPSIRIQ